MATAPPPRATERELAQLARHKLGTYGFEDWKCGVALERSGMDEGAALDYLLANGERSDDWWRPAPQTLGPARRLNVYGPATLNLVGLYQAAAVIEHGDRVVLPASFLQQELDRQDAQHRQERSCYKIVHRNTALGIERTVFASTLGYLPHAPPMGVRANSLVLPTWMLEQLFVMDGSESTVEVQPVRLPAARHVVLQPADEDFEIALDEV